MSPIASWSIAGTVSTVVLFAGLNGIEIPSCSFNSGCGTNEAR